LLVEQKAKDFALTNSRIMIHQPLGGFPQAQASAFEIHAKKCCWVKQNVNEILSSSTL
jgi:ATP-dependent Clp protease protease subunit